MKTFFSVTFALLVAACASQSAVDSHSKYEMGLDEYGPIPEADPSRHVSVQDCTHQVTMDGGNLRCQ